MRPVMEWLLDNPRRFLATVTAAILVVVLGVLGLSDPGPRPVAAAHREPVTTPTATPTPSPTPTPTASPSASATPTETPVESPPPRRTVEVAAADWVRAWLTADRPATQWRQAMAAHATGHLTDLMATANPDQVPDTRLVAVAAVQASPTFALVEARLANHQVLQVNVVLEPDGWKAAQVGSGR
jgi:hypothetical protein